VPESNLLSVRNLGVSFRSDEGLVRAVDGVDFDLPRGGTLALVGESGSGKSVTGLALLRLLGANARLDAATRIHYYPAAGGEVAVHALPSDGEALRRLRGREMAMVFQEPMSSFSPVYSIGAHIVEAMTAHQPVPKREARERAVALLERVGITNPSLRFEQLPSELSGGMRQRAMIAVALAAKPALLIADEPTTALDVTVQAQILALLRELQAAEGMAMLFITHDLGVVRQVAERILVMYQGRVMEVGPTRAVLQQPRHPYTRRLLRAAPGLATLGQRLESVGGDIPGPFERPRGCPFHPRCPDAQPGVCDQLPPRLQPLAADHAIACAVHAPEVACA
jgi:peptide/nickel transport system ATP-binding protein